MPVWRKEKNMDGIMIQKKNNEKLGGKDLINIGIYAAIYLVIMTAISMFRWTETEGCGCKCAAF